MKKHNFYAGPSILPEQVIEATKDALTNFKNTGISLASISHRSKQFDETINEAQQNFKELLDLPAGYHVLFLGGGASTQFAMIPFNLMNKKAAYLNTGTWSTKAIKEAKLFGEVQEFKNDDFFSIPKGWENKIDSDVDYVHVTTNNTIYGSELHTDFDVQPPLVADMSSDILSRKFDASKYGIIYGGAQKNCAPSGVTFVIIREDILGKVDRTIPTMLNYKTHIDKNSMFNTPPVIPIFALNETLKWVKENGGVEGMAKRANDKADLLYGEIERNKLFKGTVAKEDRSKMNICFVMNEEYANLESKFAEYAAEGGMVGIKGHRSVGGFRASTYNALPLESVQALVDCMQKFEKENA